MGLQADPEQLRHLATLFQTAADELTSKRDRLEGIKQNLLEGPAGWKGEASTAFSNKMDPLEESLRKASNEIRFASSILQTLAYRMEQITYKRQHIDHLQRQRNSLHFGLNVSVDAEIAWLGGQIAMLEAELEAESSFADVTAAAEFEAMRMEELLEQTSKQIATIYQSAESGVASAWKKIENDYEKYGQPVVDGLWEGVKEVFDIPEIEHAWNLLTDPNSSWEDRLEGAGILIGEAALDASMFIGVGEGIKSAELVAKLGLKYGSKLLEKGVAKQLGRTIVEGADSVTRQVVSGARKFIQVNRGMPGDFAFAGAHVGGDVRGGFSLYDKAKDAFVSFAGKLGDQAEKIKPERELIPKGYSSVEEFLDKVDEVKGYASKDEFRAVVENTNDYMEKSGQSIMNQSKAGTVYNGVEYDCVGFPIFEEHSVIEVRIQPEMFLKRDKIQFRQCTQWLSDAITRGEINESIFSERQLKQIRAGKPRIEGYTWHHHQVEGKLQMVPESIHGLAKHTGGRAIWGGGDAYR